MLIGIGILPVKVSDKVGGGSSRYQPENPRIVNECGDRFGDNGVIGVGWWLSKCKIVAAFVLGMSLPQRCVPEEGSGA